MAETEPKPYPGSYATAEENFRLGLAYYLAAAVLHGDADTNAPLSFAPVRLCAIHAIELFLNAFLERSGVPKKEIRGRMHDLSHLDFVLTLGLKKKTAAHLKQLTERREYLVARYGPELISEHTEISRLFATLKEVMMKTGKYLRETNALAYRH